MAPSILDVLQGKNPELNSTFVREGRNTSNDAWREFTYRNLSAIYADVLRLSFEGATGREPELAYDREIWDERSLDLFLGKYIIPIVNKALERASGHLKWLRSPYIAPGSWVGHADWQLVSHSSMYRAGDRRHYYSGLLPGDTKLSAKWQPAMEQSSKSTERHEWSLPVSQVQSYACESGFRYAFIITDLHLVILRVSLEEADTVPPGPRFQPPRAATRSAHARIISSSTDASDLLSKMSLDTPSAYSDDESVLDNSRPEYVVIPYEAKGKGQLTVKLGLFFICLMAGRGQANIRRSYAPLNSWRRLDDGTFEHDTSGVKARKQPQGAKIDNQEAEEEHPQEQHTSELRYGFREAQQLDSHFSAAESSGTSRFGGKEVASFATSQPQNIATGSSNMYCSHHMGSSAAAYQYGDVEAVPSEPPFEPDRHGQYAHYDDGGQSSDLPPSSGSQVKVSSSGKGYAFEHKGRKYQTDRRHWKNQETTKGTVYEYKSDKHTYWTRELPEAHKNKKGLLEVR